MGNAAGLAAVVAAAAAPNPNVPVAPNAGAGANVGAADAAVANDGGAAAVVAAGVAPNANDDGVLEAGAAPNPPSDGRPPPVDAGVPAKIHSIGNEQITHTFVKYSLRTVYLPKPENEPAPNVGAAAGAVEAAGAAAVAAAGGAAGVPNENALAVAGAEIRVSISFLIFYGINSE